MSQKSILPLILLGMLFLCAYPTGLSAQVTKIPTPEEVRKVLNENDITEAEFRSAMMAKGYDLENIDINTVDLEELERVSLQVVAELSQQKQEAVQENVEKAVDQASSETAEKIEKAIDEGASPEEAISEELQDLANEELPETGIYGHNLFRNKDMTVFRQADRIKPPRSYVLGVGDELSITINGLSQESIRTTIDPEGFISISGKPPVPIGGLTLEQAEDLLRRRLKAYYSYNDNQFYLSVLTARTVTVNFYGEVVNPGGITLSAVNTLFNALVAAGGPTDIGSVRRIRLISGSTEKVFDTYVYMQDPSIAGEFSLKDNDYVHIPVARRVVSIKGAVRRAFKYELLEDEHLVKLIEYAGGVLEDAYLRDIQITRYNADQRVVINVNLRDILDSGGDYLLEPGDEVVISKIDEEVLNKVVLQGAVVKPGDYERREGMRVSDLLAAGGIKPDARRDYGYVLRRNPNRKYSYVRFSPENALANPGSGDDLLLESMDIVRIPSLVEYSDDVEFVVRGAVRIPGPQGFDPGGILRVQDALLVAGGLRQSAASFGYILRRPPEDPEAVDYIVFNPRVAIENGGAVDNHIIMPYDSIVIFDRYELADNFFISVQGAVRKPGRYRYDPNLTLAQAIDLAGGIRFDASTERVDISRLIIDENQPTRTINLEASTDRVLTVRGDSTMVLFPFDRIFVRSVPQFELQKIVRIEGEVQFPGGYAILEDNERILSIVQRAGGLTTEAFAAGALMYRQVDSIGKVVIELDKAVSNPNSSSNLILQDGDRIFIPKQPDLVSITGAVNIRDLYTEEFIEDGNRINVAFEKGKNAKYYIDNYAGGLSDDARKRLITVRQASGRLERTKNFLFFKVYPKVEKGATINVGRKPPPDPVVEAEKEEIDWGRVVATTLAQATAILTLILLVDRL